MFEFKLIDGIFFAVFALVLADFVGELEFAACIAHHDGVGILKTCLRIDDVHRLVHRIVFHGDVHLARLDVVFIDVRDIERHRALLSLAAVDGDGVLCQESESFVPFRS